MTDNTAFLKRKILALFNFLSMKHKNDKRIGELSVKDVMEMVKFLNEEVCYAEHQ